MYASSPYHSSYISYGTYKENLSINQEYVCAVFSYSFPNSFMCIFLLDELFWTALHQLYQWKTATAFQSHNVHFGAGTVSNFLRVSLDVPSSAVFDFLQLLDKRFKHEFYAFNLLWSGGFGSDNESKSLDFEPDMCRQSVVCKGLPQSSFVWCFMTRKGFLSLLHPFWNRWWSL